MQSTIRPLAVVAISHFAEAVSRLERLLRESRHTLDDNEIPVVDWITERLKYFRDQAQSWIISVFAITVTDQELTDIFNEVLAQSRELAKTHAALRHLSIPGALREARLFSDEAAQKIACTGASLKKPALCLTSDIEPSEHGLGEESVVSLAKLDYGNPLSWPLLIHEVAHGWFGKVELVRGLRAAWLIELGCDALAIQVAGPAALAAIGIRSINKPAYHKGSVEHPPPSLRVSVMLQTCPKWIKKTSLWKTISALHTARHRVEPSSPVLNGKIVACRHCGSELARLTTNEETVVQAAFSDVLTRIATTLEITEFRRSNFRTSVRLSAILSDRVLIGGSHDNTIANELLGSFLKASSKSAALPSQRGATASNAANSAMQAPVELFKALRLAVCDSPHSLLEIINAGWLCHFRETEGRLLQLAAASGDLALFANAWEGFTSTLKSFDELLLASVETADFHSRIADIRTFDAE